MSTNGNRLPIIESLILSSTEPLPARKIATVVDDLNVRQVEEAVEQLNQKYVNNALSFRIRKIAGGFQSYITEDYTEYVEELLTRQRVVRLTRAALETMAIIAYRQPVTKMDIELIRGVASDSVVRTLLERKLVILAGRAETVGKPLLYKTTDEFLKFFDLDSIDDLPRMEEIEELLAISDVEPQPTLPLSTATVVLPKKDEAVDTDNEDNNSEDEQSLKIAETSETPHMEDSEELPEIQEISDNNTEEPRPESVNIENN